MKNWLYLFILAILFVSCDSETAEVTEPLYDETRDENLDLNALAHRHVRATLDIPASEKYTLVIHRKKLDADDYEDAVILVNRYEKAMNDALEHKNTPQRAETGFMGSYNHVFYFDGGLQKITRPIDIASSAILPLKIEFRNIQSEGYADFIIEYRIRDAAYKNFFTVRSHTPFLVFQWKTFDALNTARQECYYFGYGEGSKSLAKDILIFPGEFVGTLPTELFQPVDNAIKRKENTEMLYRFFYDPKQGKYFTNSPKPDEDGEE